METAVARWQALIRARATQMDAAYAHLGRTSADFWDRRARNFHRTTRSSASHDPLYLFLREHVTSAHSVLDVGAGTGRFTLALAPLAAHVTALEPNPSMLHFLREEVTACGLTNVTPIQSTWENAPTDLQADLVVCSHVLYPIMDIVPFLQKLHAASKQACYLYMRAVAIDALTAPLWQHFHGTERCLPPGYIHAQDVLYELGVYANVTVVTIPYAFHYPSLDAAEDELMEQLILEDTAQTRTELRTMLTRWLIEGEDGSWRSPEQNTTSAIVWWQR